MWETAVAAIVRHFWLWIMTVGSKLNGYGYESNGGFHSEFYQNDGTQTAYAHHLNSHYNNWNWGPENMQSHRVSYLGDIIFLTYNSQLIIAAARERGLEETHCRWIGSMLECRLIHTSLTGSSLNAKVAGGCLQGGVLSPLLWNLVADRLLTIINDLGFSTFGYADDIFIIVQGKFANTVREIMQKALNVVAKWAVKEGLNISPHKIA